MGWHDVGVRRDGASELALGTEGGEDIAEGRRRPDEGGSQRHKVSRGTFEPRVRTVRTGICSMDSH